MSAALIAKLVQAGTPADLVGEVAMALAKAEAAAEILETRRRHERERKAKSRDVTGQNVTERDSADKPPASLDKETSPTPPKEIKPTAPPRAQSAPAWALPVGVSFQVWQDFLTNRKRKRAPNTETAWKRFNDDLQRVSSQTGIPPPKLIEHAAAKGWAGIYEPEDEGNGRTHSMARHQPSDGLSPTTRAAARIFGTAPTRHAGTVSG